jgi:hypothetical protein
VFVVPPTVSRRAFLKAAVAGVALPSSFLSQPAARETLYNGIVLPSPWPPRRVPPVLAPDTPPYLASPPDVIDITVGRQLFVDDFLIEQSSLYRTFHQARYYASNPVLAPQEPWETRDPHAINTGIQPSQAAMPFSDGVWFDASDGLFKMFYMAGYQQATALATSRDGLSWQRPRLPVVPGTNIVSPAQRDSSTVWLDHGAPRPSRFKMASYVFRESALVLRESPDGIRWRDAGKTGPCGDRSTFFQNPFRNLWAFSLRADDPAGARRYRRYFESRDFASTTWAEGDPVSWAGADAADLKRADFSAQPELYNLDAVAYESVMLGLFTIFRGEQTTREKPNDLCIAFSRDGFHWDRSLRDPFIGVSERQGDWNWANVQSAGGCCTIVGEQLYFYVSGRQGIPGSDLPGRCSTGLATLRRDGFASLSDQWPEGRPREIRGADRSSLVTRPLRFRGTHLFVNADAPGDIRVEILDRAGQVIAPFAAAQCEPVRGDSTRHQVRWRNAPGLQEISSQPVRFRFVLNRAHLYAFWVASSEAGHSRGYAAAGGPDYPQGYDAE